MRQAPAFLLMFVAVTGLGGCGYRPLYGTSAESVGVNATLASVSIPEADTRVGQIIRNDLISAMHSGNGEDRYTLTLTPVVKTNDINLQPQPAITRQAINLSVAYELLDRGTGAKLHTGMTFSQVSYDVIRQPFAEMPVQQRVSGTNHEINDLARSIDDAETVGTFRIVGLVKIFVDDLEESLLFLGTDDASGVGLDALVVVLDLAERVTFGRTGKERGLNLPQFAGNAVLLQRLGVAEDGEENFLGENVLN